MAEVVTIGETMVAFTPKNRGFLHYNKDYEMKIAGAESNLAVGIAKLGHSAEWMSALGEDEFGIVVQNAVRAEGVETKNLIFSPEYRTGIMFKQMQGVETAVFYYRENSAASHMNANMIQPELLKQTKILHLTGITPVLSEECEKMIWSAIELSKKENVLLSFDPNIRKKLWKKDHSQMLREMTLEAEIVMLGVEEGEQLFGISDRKELINKLFSEGQARYIAVKDGGKGATVADREHIYDIPAYPCHCIDPIGAGDAFNAGFLCGILEEKDIETCGRMGAIAGAMATENYGDIEGYPSRKQLENRLNQNQEVLR